jgi:small subunit ribosomal protein S16
MQRLRLSRKGQKNRPFYHVVATDQRKALHGEYNMKLGDYDPFTKALHLDMDALQRQLDNGAQPSKMVQVLIRRRRKELAEAAGQVAA